MRSTYTKRETGPGDWLRNNATPVTYGFLALMIAGPLAGFFTPEKRLLVLALHHPSSPPVWSFITHPFAGMLPTGFGWLFWLCFVMFFIQTATSVEVDLGWRRFVIFLLAATALNGLIVWLGSLAFGLDPYFAGDVSMIAAVVCVWCTRHSGNPIGFWGIPMAARWFGYLMALIAFTHYGFASPAIGLLACLHLPIVSLFASNKIPRLQYTAPVYQPNPSKAARERDSKYFDEVREREQERQERERLRKLFEGSLEDKDR